MNSAPLLGNNAVNCPKILCPPACAPCDHKQFVYENILNFTGNPLNLTALFDSVLTVHENYMQQLCLYIEDICLQGEKLGFPCMQCGVVSLDCLTLGESITDLTTKGDCVCLAPIIYHGCDVGWVDFSAPEYIGLYEAILEALKSLRGEANGDNIVDFISKFYPNASLIGFYQGYYQINLGEVPVEQLRILPLLESIAPLPIGAKIQFYVADCNLTATI